MKRIITAFVILLVTSTAWAQFRGLEWGTLRGEVIDQKGDDYVASSETELVYEREVLGYTSVVSFVFRDEQLAFGKIAMYNADFQRVREALNERFDVKDSGRGSQYSWETDTTWVSLSRSKDWVEVEYADPVAWNEAMEELQREEEAQRREDAKEF